MDTAQQHLQEAIETAYRRGDRDARQTFRELCSLANMPLVRTKRIDDELFGIGSVPAGAVPARGEAPEQFTNAGALHEALDNGEKLRDLLHELVGLAEAARDKLDDAEDTKVDALDATPAREDVGELPDEPAP